MNLKLLLLIYATLLVFVVVLTERDCKSGYQICCIRKL